MGKGNRNRNDRYEGVYSMSGAGAVAKAPKGGAKKDRSTTLLITAIVVMLAVFACLTFVVQSGFMARNTKYVSSDNFEVTGTMIPYYENLAYMNTFNWYLEIFYSIYPNDINKAYEQAVNQMNGYTLSSFFDSAITSAKEIVALAEEATANGVKLEAEDHEDIQKTLDEMKGVSFGTGVKKRDIKAAIELHTLASKYAQSVSKELEDGVTDEKLLTYMMNHKSDYYSADVLKFELLLKAADYEDAVALAEAEKVVDAYANKLKEATTPEEFKRLVIEYKVELLTDGLINANLGSLEAPSEELVTEAKAALVENLYEAIVNKETFESGVVTEAPYAEVFETVASKLYATCTSDIANLSVTEAYSAAADDEIIKWLSDGETTTGSVKLFDPTPSTETSNTDISKTVCYVETGMRADDSLTKNVAHILIKANESSATAEERAAAKAEAEALLAEFLAGDEVTREAFEKLAEEHNDDGTCVYENMPKGMMVAPFENWAYDEARQAGDTGVVETIYGYHIMYFIADGKPAYYENAVAGYVNDEYADFVDELIEKYVTVNDKVVTADTTAAA